MLYVELSDYRLMDDGAKALITHSDRGPSCSICGTIPYPEELCPHMWRGRSLGTGRPAFERWVADLKQ